MRQDSNIFYLKEDSGDNQDIVILKDKVNVEEFKKAIREIWDTLTSQEEYDFDTFYDMIEERYEVEEFVFIDNLPCVRY